MIRAVVGASEPKAVLRLCLVLATAVLLPMVLFPSGAQAQEVIDTIPVGSGPSDVAYSHTTNEVFVATGFDGTIAVIDSATDEVTNTISVGTRVGDMALLDWRGWLFVIRIESADYYYQIVKIDIASESVVDHVWEYAGHDYIACSNTKVYAAGSGDEYIDVYEADTLSRVTWIPVPSAGHMAVNRQTGRLYVYVDSGEIYVIDTSSDTVIDTIEVAPVWVRRIAVDSQKDRIYLADNDGYISAINGSTGAVTKRRFVGDGPRGLEVYRNVLYVACYDEGTLKLVDANNLKITSEADVGDDPRDPANNFLMGKVYVAIADDSVAVVATAPYVRLSTDLETYLPGSAVHLDVDIANPYVATGYRFADVHVALTLPTGEELEVHNTQDLVLPPGFHGTIPLRFMVPLSVFVPEGEYAFSAVLEFATKPSDYKETTDTVSFMIERH